MENMNIDGLQVTAGRPQDFTGDAREGIDLAVHVVSGITLIPADDLPRYAVAQDPHMWQTGGIDHINRTIEWVLNSLTRLPEAPITGIALAIGFGGPWEQEEPKGTADEEEAFPLPGDKLPRAHNHAVQVYRALYMHQLRFGRRPQPATPLARVHFLLSSPDLDPATFIRGLMAARAEKEREDAFFKKRFAASSAPPR